MDRNTGSWLVTVTDCLSHDIIPSLYANAGITGKWQPAHPRSAAIARDVAQILYRSFLEIALRFCFSAHRDLGGRMRLEGDYKRKGKMPDFPAIVTRFQLECHISPPATIYPVLLACQYCLVLPLSALTRSWTPPMCSFSHPLSKEWEKSDLLLASVCCLGSLSSILRF